MATTVAQIAADAFDAVGVAITDAIKAATLSDGTTDYAGRVVFGGETAPAGFPMATAKDKLRPAYLEGFGVIPAPGWTILADGVTHYVTGVRDVVEAGTFTVANVIKSSDLLWKTVTFERDTPCVDDYGARVPYWTAIAGAENISAGIMVMSGQEQWERQRLEVHSRWQLIVPYIDGLTERDRVQIDGRPYSMSFVHDIERRGVWLVIDLDLGRAT
jgi:SPP1 family predicted phage head-tail adaptor